MNGELIRDPETGQMVKPCGTEAAWRRHYARGEKPCMDCKAARSRKQHIYRYRRHEMSNDPWTVAWIEPCGTNAGYQYHKHHGQEPCGSCREAHNIRKVLDEGRCRHDYLAKWCIPCHEAGDQ